MNAVNFRIRWFYFSPLLLHSLIVGIIEYCKNSGIPDFFGAMM